MSRVQVPLLTPVPALAFDAGPELFPVFALVRAGFGLVAMVKRSTVPVLMLVLVRDGGSHNGRGLIFSPSATSVARTTFPIRPHPPADLTKRQAFPQRLSAFARRPRSSPANSCRTSRRRRCAVTVERWIPYLLRDRPHRHPAE